MSIAYNISLALLGLEEDKLRRKGEQDGSIRWKGNACYIRFREWRADKDGNLRYAPTEKRIAGDFPRTARGEREALLAGYEQWVSKANAVNKAPAGLATVEQFYETRFQIDHIDHLKKKTAGTFIAPFGRTTSRRHWGRYS